MCHRVVPERKSLSRFLFYNCLVPMSRAMGWLVHWHWHRTNNQCCTEHFHVLSISILCSLFHQPQPQVWFPNSNPLKVRWDPVCILCDFWKVLPMPMFMQPDDSPHCWWRRGVRWGRIHRKFALIFLQIFVANICANIFFPKICKNICAKIFRPKIFCKSLRKNLHNFFSPKNCANICEKFS